MRDLSPESHATAAIAAASAGLIDLAHFVRDGDSLSATEVVENMADACKLTIEASGRTDDEAMQLLAALSKYLDGWA